MNPKAEQLARALRSGLELRWSIPASRSNHQHQFPRDGSVRAFLEPCAEALEHRLRGRRSPLNRLLRALYYLMRLLMAPWLGLQSHFNLSTISALEQIELRVRALEDAERKLRQDLEMLQKTKLEIP